MTTTALNSDCPGLVVVDVEVSRAGGQARPYCRTQVSDARGVAHVDESG